MKLKPMREARQAFAETVEECQDERVILTRHGKPVAMLVGVQGRDLDDVLLAANPEVWRAVQRAIVNPRRISLAEARKRLEKKHKAEAPRAKTKRRKPR